MKSFVIIFFFLLTTSKVNGQLLPLLQAVKGAKDTTISVRYFKTIDPIIIEKIDSFLALKEIKLPNCDSAGFLMVNLGAARTDEVSCFIEFNHQACDFLGATNENLNFYQIAGFSFYKSYLVVFRFEYIGRFTATHGNNPLFKEMVFQQISPWEQQIYLKDPTVVIINRPLLYKEYRIKSIQ